MRIWIPPSIFERKNNMKKIIRILSIVMAVVMAAGILAGCNANNFTIDEVIDAGEGQQRWLRHPQSPNLVINPEALNGAEYQNADKNLALSLGIEKDGNLIATIPNALFILESKTANGMMAETVDQFEYDGDNECRGLSALVMNASSGTKLVGETGDDTATIASKLNVVLDNSTSYYVVITVNSLEGFTYTSGEGEEATEVEQIPSVEVKVTIDKTDNTFTVATITEPGTYVYDLSPYCSQVETTKATRKCTYKYVLSAHSKFEISNCQLCTFPSGAVEATEEMKTEFGLAYLKSTQRYPNQTAIEVKDLLIADSASRLITCTADGVLVIGGEFKGTPTYDAKNNMFNIDCGSYKYQVAPKRKGVITYYASYEDLLNGVGGFSEISSSAKFWSMTVSDLHKDDFFAVAVSASADKSFEELTEKSKKATSNTTVLGKLDKAEEWWNMYIAAYDVSDYIENKPQ